MLPLNQMNYGYRESVAWRRSMISNRVTYNWCLFDSKIGFRRGRTGCSEKRRSTSHRFQVGVHDNPKVADESKLLSDWRWDNDIIRLLAIGRPTPCWKREWSTFCWWTMDFARSLRGLRNDVHGRQGPCEGPARPSRRPRRTWTLQRGPRMDHHKVTYVDIATTPDVVLSWTLSRSKIKQWKIKKRFLKWFKRLDVTWQHICYLNYIVSG
jgi:hypothetical protein